METNEQPPTSILQQPHNQQDLVSQSRPVEFTENSTNSANSLATSTNNSSSVVRPCAPQAFKFFMEQHAENVLKHHKAREYRRMQLETEMISANLKNESKDQMRKLLIQKETNYLRLRRAKLNTSMFETIKILGIGGFAEVNLVRKKDERSSLYAMKILHKSEVFNLKQAAHVKAERDILAEADNEWVVKLYYSFQDEENLYFVMDYVPGGDLMSLLKKLQIFDEELARFYIGELTCAIESVHALGFIHRDIKPDNILIDRNGHIKLTDFGLCTGFHWTHDVKHYLSEDAARQLLEKRRLKADGGGAGGQQQNSVNSSCRRLMAHSLVGSPNYMAPEILSGEGYTKSCDWWSVGVILYEMLVGKAPFWGEDTVRTQVNVINWKQTLQIPEESKLCPEAKDLIFKLCTSSENRLSADGIKAHPFFRNFDFGPRLRRSQAPYIPPIKDPTDTSNFEPVDQAVINNRKAKRDHHLNQQYQNYQHASKKANSNYYTNGQSMMNMYEFTFRRFVDDAAAAHSGNSENSVGGSAANIENVEPNSTLADRSVIKNVREPTARLIMDATDSESMDLMETGGSMTNEVATPANRTVDQNSLSYQTERLIDSTKKIQLKERTNNTWNSNNNGGTSSSSSSSAFFGSGAGSFNNENLNTMSAGGSITAPTAKQPPVYI